MRAEIHHSTRITVFFAILVDDSGELNDHFMWLKSKPNYRQGEKTAGDLAVA